jgi:acyl-CoA synthetase (AMP-forming)/AMP-acid ligase II
MEFNVADLFESVAGAVPEREALVCGAQRRTFAELDEQANRLARYLAAQGVKAGDHLGLYLHNCAEYLEAMLAAFKIRAVPINVNFRYVEKELRYLIDNADLVALIYHREFGPRVASVARDFPALRTFLVVSDDSDANAVPGTVDYDVALEGSPPARDFPARSGGDLFIIYTGGTTGMPKGVMWRHEDLFFSGMLGGNPGGLPVERPEELAELARSKPPMSMMAVPPLIHGAAQLASFIAFFQGAKIVLVPRFDPAKIWRAVEAERVNTMSIVGDAMARPLAEALLAPGADYDTSSLFVMSSAGAIFSEAVKAQLRQKLPHLMMIDAFGASETGSQGMDTGIEPGGGPGLRFKMNENTAVLDDHLRPVAPGSGVVGRVALRRHIPLGYYKDAQKTARTFVEVDGVRWVLPGDLARVEADGTVTVFGRGSMCINSGGEKIFPEEVEAALKSHPAVFDAIVVGVPDERWGERVAAVVQPRPGCKPTLQELDAHCRTQIAGYKVPRELHLVAQMSRSPSGKPDYPWAKEVAGGRLRGESAPLKPTPS